jgi:hypothetical protein
MNKTGKDFFSFSSKLNQQKALLEYQTWPSGMILRAINWVFICHQLKILDLTFPKVIKVLVMSNNCGPFNVQNHSRRGKLWCSGNLVTGQIWKVLVKFLNLHDAILSHCERNWTRRDLTSCNYLITSRLILKRNRNHHF